MRSALIIWACTWAVYASAQLVPSCYVESKTFFDPAKGPYVDVNIAVLGASLVHVANDHGFQQASIETLTIIQKAGAIVDFRKTLVKGPERLDTIHSDFIHQEHFILPPGDYVLEVEVRDLQGDTIPSRSRGTIAVAGRPDGIWFSDVLLGDPDASDKTMVPYISNFYPSEVSALLFYNEVYGADAEFGTDSLFLLSYEVETYETRALFGGLRKQLRSKAAAVIPINGSFDISSLPSGNYLLAIEARDRAGKVHKRKEFFFQRSNPISYDVQNLTQLDMHNTFVDAFTDADSLKENILSLRPIASDLERRMIDDRNKDKDLELMKRFFYSFWYNRNSYDPASAWNRYRQEVILVNQIYGCRVKRGFETDRGATHLKYGPPNTIMAQANDADGYPYQIWHYYRVGKYSNKRFVFYLPDRVTECYELLHSDVPGEMKNPNWNQMLHVANTPMNNVQDNTVPQGHGQQVQSFYDLPR